MATFKNDQINWSASARHSRLILSTSLMLIVLFFFTFSSLSANAANISKLPSKEGEPDIIIFSGEIGLGDDAVFTTLSLQTESAIVIFDSPGGLIRPALEIGRTIRIKGFSTGVINSNCTSACAIAWLAGQPRMLTKNANVGFHAAYVQSADGQKLPSSVANALIGAYLNTLGLGQSVIEYVTAADPDSITWLSEDDASDIGLTVSLLDDKQQARANFNLAVQSRRGANPSIEEAVRLYRLSADDGFAGAQNNLGDLYETGTGVIENEGFSIYWYTRAAERGEPTAYLSLSTILSQGTNDEAVLIEAFKFSLLAAAGLPDGHNKQVAEETMLKIGAQLSDAARDRAFELTGAWEPLYQEKYLMSDSPDR